MTGKDKIEKKPERISHHYTDELELKSLLIRLKNEAVLVDDDLKEDEELLRENLLEIKQNKELNSFINSDIRRYIRLKTDIKDIVQNSSCKNANARVRFILDTLKDRIIKNSEVTIQDKASREQFGSIVLLMVKNILRKPNFAMLEYHEDFYSDASYKIFRYMKNFDHTKISERSGYHVNAFAYISQIIHNSVIYVINQRKREFDKIQEYYAEQPMSNKSSISEVYNDDDIFIRLRDICPLEFPFNISDAYPFVIKDMLNFIESNYTPQCKESIPQRIVDYAETSKLGVTLVGDAIRSDYYLTQFIEKSTYSNKDTSW